MLAKVFSQPAKQRSLLYYELQIEKNIYIFNQITTIMIRIKRNFSKIIACVTENRLPDFKLLVSDDRDSAMGLNTARFNTPRKRVACFFISYLTYAVLATDFRMSRFSQNLAKYIIS